jgi:hypothetical protein
MIAPAADPTSRVRSRTVLQRNTMINQKMGSDTILQAG